MKNDADIGATGGVALHFVDIRNRFRDENAVSTFTPRRTVRLNLSKPFRRYPSTRWGIPTPRILHQNLKGILIHTDAQTDAICDTRRTVLNGVGADFIEDELDIRAAFSGELQPFR